MQGRAVFASSSSDVFFIVGAMRTPDGNDPCTDSTGKRKKRWPNEDAAWFVAEQRATVPRHGNEPDVSIVYHCPACGGWHLATAKNAGDQRRHRQGVQRMRTNLQRKSRK